MTPDEDHRKLLSFKWVDPAQNVLHAPALEVRVYLDPDDAPGRQRIRSQISQAMFNLLAAIDREKTP